MNTEKTHSARGHVISQLLFDDVIPNNNFFFVLNHTYRLHLYFHDGNNNWRVSNYNWRASEASETLSGLFN